MQHRLFIFASMVLLAFTVFYSCKKKDTAQPETIDYSYFPLDSGRYFIYKVDTITYDEFKKDTTAGSYQEKQVVIASSIDNKHNIVKQLNRYRRANDTAQWVFVNTFTANLTTSTAEVVDDNERVIKLVFPVTAGKTWNCNAYNMEGATSYTYSQTGENASILGKKYPNTATILQKNDTNLIKHVYAAEKYAPNIGLVYKVSIEDSSTASDLSTPFNTRITGGIEMHMSIISYGK